MRTGRWAAALLSAAALILGLWGPVFSIRLDWLFLGTALGIDDVNRPFLIVTGLAWLTASALLADTPTRGHGARFVSVFWLALLGNLLTVLSQDIVTFYTAFAVMGLSAYGLVVHAGGPRSRFAGRVYITLTIMGEVLLFAAMVGLVQYGGRAVFPIEPAPVPAWLVLCLLAGFGVKGGLVPLHVSLPLIYRAAPLAGGVALAGAALNAGILGWLRWLPVPGTGASTGVLLIILGVAGYLYSVAVGLTQRHPRALLGYSSASQVALMVVVVGTGTLAPQYWPALLAGVLVMMLNHAVAKTYLFAVSGLRVHSRLWRALTWAGIVVAGAGLAGAPLTGGYASKSVLKEALLRVPDIGLLADALWVSSALTAALMARFAWLLARFPRRAATPLERAGVFAPLAALAAMTIVAVAHYHWSLAGFMASVAPIVGAVLLAAWVARRSPGVSPAGLGRRLSIPVGDLAVPIAAWLRRLGALLNDAGSALGEMLERFAAGMPATKLPTSVERTANAPDPEWSRAAVRVLAFLAVIVFLLIVLAG